MGTPNRIAALARILMTPGGIRAAAYWRPFSLTAFAMARTLRAQGLQPDLIVDGGANVGQFARAMAETFPDARVVSFEPLPDVAASFRSHFASTSRVRLVEAALGAEAGTLAFHRNPYSLASSALPVAEDDDLVVPHSETVSVPVTTLDLALHDEMITPSTLLKLDLQGFELEALRGASETLRQVGTVLLEIALRPSYSGEPSFEALLDHLRPFGFRFLRPIDILRDSATGEIVQMDALFAATT
ncbi:MAG: FkbM family methyltransferase [Bacteroidota bacterium]